jgi:hypothetical protein
VVLAGIVLLSAVSWCGCIGELWEIANEIPDARELSRFALEARIGSRSVRPNLDPNDTISGALERNIAAGVGALALTVIRAIDLNHEALRGSQEVCDEAPE